MNERKPCFKFRGYEAECLDCGRDQEGHAVDAPVQRTVMLPILASVDLCSDACPYLSAEGAHSWCRLFEVTLPLRIEGGTVRRRHSDCKGSELQLPTFTKRHHELDELLLVKGQWQDPHP